MPAPVLLVVAGTRSEVLECCPLVQALRQAPRYSLPFETRLLVTGQEDTELEQTLDALELEADENLGVKTSHVADAALAARLLGDMEVALRHHAPAAVVVVGYSASAWATAVAAYYKNIPLIHLGAGQVPVAHPRPFPEWLHARTFAQLAGVHLCPDEAAADVLRAELDSDSRIEAPEKHSPRRKPSEEPADDERKRGMAPEADKPLSTVAAAPEIHVTGMGADSTLAQSLAAPPLCDEDPTLSGLRPDAPRLLFFVRRREHHANALRPLCQAVELLAGRHADCEFIVAYSLQAHICDALSALLPKCANVRGISPLPHPVFVRELARARVVVTDSAGVAREALLLGRPAIAIGACSMPPGLGRLAAERRLAMTAVPMAEVPIESAVSSMLEHPAPGPAPRRIETPDPGSRTVECILDWWKRTQPELH